MSDQALATAAPVIEVKEVTKRFGDLVAVADVSLEVRPGEVLCLLGDNGAGKSTLIKLISGVFQPSAGEIRVDGERTRFSSPREARDRGIATVHQYGGTVPLLSVARNFFLGVEPTKGRGPFRRIDESTANRVAVENLRELGITRVHDGRQLVGTLSGGERQALAIGRAMYFGARLLILDEPTSALGVKEAATVLRLVAQARARGVAVILITHNASHALTVADRLVVLIHGSVAASFSKGGKTREEVLDLMAGGQELQSLMLQLEHLDKELGPENRS